MMAAARRYQFDGHKPPVVERAKWVDTDQDWKPRVNGLADELGWKRPGIWFWFRQISLAIFLEARWPQPCAEAWAFECLRRAIDKRGQEPS